MYYNILEEKDIVLYRNILKKIICVLPLQMME